MASGDRTLRRGFLCQAGQRIARGASDSADIPGLVAFFTTIARSDSDLMCVSNRKCRVL